MEKFQKQGDPVLLPEVRFPHLIDYFHDVGPTMHGGMGPSPLSHIELRAWERAMGIELAPWETRALRLMSRAYIGQSQRAEAPDCPAPYGFSGPGRAAVAKKIDEAFG